MIIDPKEKPWIEVYRFLTDTVQPRPIALVSSVDPEGRANLAPFSFFNVVCARPPILAFSPMRRGQKGDHKDTVRNIKATKQYVISVVTEAIVQRVNQASFDYTPEVDEFAEVGLEKGIAVRVKPPLVASSPVNFECELRQVLEFGEGAGGGDLIVGEAILIHCDERVLTGSTVAREHLRTLGRMGGAHYVETRESTVSIARPLHADSIYAEISQLVHGAHSDAPRARAALQKAVDVLHRARPRHLFTGVYVLRGETLELDAFAGPPTEHSKIAVGKGLCGQAVAKNIDMDVADVSQADGYLACSIDTRSEAIVLIRHEGQIVGQIDIDSAELGSFGEEAMRSLRVVAEILAPIVGTLAQR